MDDLKIFKTFQCVISCSSINGMFIKLNVQLLMMLTVP